MRDCEHERINGMKEFKERVVRGGLAKVGAQGMNFAVRLGAIATLARFLSPRDFGLVGMVTAITGVLSLLRDFGLSAATVQRLHVTEEQVSSFFWFNLLFGAILALCVIAIASPLARFYDEPRLLWVTIALAPAFIFNGAGVQHSAILQRQMRFTTLSVIDVVSLSLSSGVAIGMAAAGFEYWALVASAVCLPLVSTSCLWIAARWVPGRPRRGVGLRSMVRFGGTISLLQIVTYVSSNVDKVLLGRYWGANVLGFYGRGYQLINIPTLLLNSAVGDVAFALLSRHQNDRVRLRNYFLKSYSMVVAMTVPLTVCAGVFAPDIVLVVLGPKWRVVGPIARLLAPTILGFGLSDPIFWFMCSQGMLGRSLRLSLVFTAVVITGYVIGLPFGPKGVALGSSSAMLLAVVPRIAWGLHGTGISLRDVGRAASAPLISGAIALSVGVVLQLFGESSLSPLLRLLINSAIVLGTYAVVLLYVLRQKSLYFDLVRTAFGRQNAAALTEPPPP